MSPTKKTSTKLKPSAEEFLKSEYEILNQWAMHGQNTINQLFNFYVSLLTASLGALVVIIQIAEAGLSTVMILAACVAFLLVIVGVVFLDALITQYSRNASYHAGIISIQIFYKQDPELGKTLQEHPSVSIEADAEAPNSLIARYFPFLKYLLPVGIQQIFISLVNSLLISAMIVCIVFAVKGIAEDFLRTIVGAAISFVAAFTVQNLFARFELQEDFDRIRALKKK
jgi:hypothetical protein